jgi:hypothetical protein
VLCRAEVTGDGVIRIRDIGHRSIGGSVVSLDAETVLGRRNGIAGDGYGADRLVAGDGANGDTVT